MCITYPTLGHSHVKLSLKILYNIVGGFKKEALNTTVLSIY